MKSIQEATVREGITKAKFGTDKITVHWEVDRRDTKEVNKPTIHDVGHTDLQVQRHEVAKKVLHLMGAPEGWKEKARVEEVRRDLENYECKFKISILLEWSVQRFVIETPGLNDLTFNDTEKLFAELSEFVTGEKRSQTELDFA